MLDEVDAKFSEKGEKVRHLMNFSFIAGGAGRAKVFYDIEKAKDYLAE